MSFCFHGVNSQKAKVFLGITATFCLILRVAVVNLWRQPQSSADEKYNKRKWKWERKFHTRRYLCLALAVVCLWDPWTASWLGGTRFWQPYNYPSAPQLDCDAGRMIERGQQLGQGYFGVVTEGDLNGTKIAVKSIHVRDEFVGRNEYVMRKFEDEKRILQLCQFSPYVVKLLGECKGELYMELLDMPLGRYIESRRAPFTEMEIMELWMSVAKALDALHRAPGGPILHMDIHEDQFLFNSDKVLKLTDFNRAQQLTYGLHGFCQKGHPLRRGSPEQFQRGLVTEKSDIYSLGYLFFLILTGKPGVPRRGPGVKKVYPVSLPQIPEGKPLHLKSILERMWQKKPKDRPSASQIVGELEYLLKMHRGQSRSQSPP